MNTITLQTLKTNGAKAISDHEVTYLIVNSKPKSVLVPPEEYEALLDMQEELEDIRDIEARRGEPLIEWTGAFPKEMKKSTKKKRAK